MVTLNNITKIYNKGAIKAVNDVSFKVNKGEIFGLIGPDGAGKTSIFRMLTTLLLPDGGTASINDWDIVKDYAHIRSNIGYMPEKFSLYSDLTVEENLDFFATVYETSIRENYDLIKDIYVQLQPFKNRRAGKLSGGMKQKLSLCCALIHKPAVLFLDDPTSGVDAVSRREFWLMLRKLNSSGITILVSTPYMDEATLCDRIALIQKGNILTIDTPQGIIDSYPDKLYALRAENTAGLGKLISSFEDTSSCIAFGDSLHVTFKTPITDTAHLRKYFGDKGFAGFEITEIRPTIEDCFIHFLN